jgi:hypothetical protein
MPELPHNREPGLLPVSTGNAAANKYMIAINDHLGLRISAVSRLEVVETLQRVGGSLRLVQRPSEVRPASHQPSVEPPTFSFQDSAWPSGSGLLRSTYLLSGRRCTPADGRARGCMRLEVVEPWPGLAAVLGAHREVPGELEADLPAPRSASGH